MSGQGGKEPTWGLAGVGRSWFWEAQSTRREAAAERRVSETPQGCKGQWGGGGHCSSPEEDGQCVPLANWGRALRGWARQDSRGQAQHPLPVLLCTEGLRQVEAGLGHSLCRASLIWQGLIQSQGAWPRPPRAGRSEPPVAVPSSTRPFSTGLQDPREVGLACSLAQLLLGPQPAHGYGDRCCPRWKRPSRWPSVHSGTFPVGLWLSRVGG